MSYEYRVPAKSRREIEDYAGAWRSALGVPTYCQVPDMISLLENEMPKLFDDFALLVKDDGLKMDGAEGYTEFEPVPRIVLATSTYVDAANNRGRGRWTAAHELGHLVLHKGAVPFERTQVKYAKKIELPVFQSAEWQANAFAAGFLMPEYLVRDFSDAGEISDFFSVSRQAAENRIKTLGLLPRNIITPQVALAIRHIEGRK